MARRQLLALPKSRPLPKGPLSTLNYSLLSFLSVPQIHSYLQSCFSRTVRNTVLNPVFWVLNKCSVSSEGSKALLRDDKRANETVHSSTVLSSSKPCCVQVRKLTTPLPTRFPRLSLAQAASLPAATHPSGGVALGFLSGSVGMASTASASLTEPRGL